MKTCDHKSAGILVKNGGAILIIERKKFPAGFALPAGHLDGDSFKEAAARELKEESGIIAEELELLLDVELPNPCRRTDGTYHRWQIFRAKKWKGELKLAEDEAKTIEWASPKRLKNISKRTEEYAEKRKIDLTDLQNLTKTLSNDQEWQSAPGLEPVWYYFLKQPGLA